mgnify:CR=1 FL=1|jgi:hypothetical protein
MHNIYFFQVNFEVGKGAFSTFWLPHASACIWAYAQQFDDIRDQFEAKDFAFQREDDLDILVTNLDNPFLVAVSWYSWNRNYSLALAAKVKQYYPDAIVLFGGPEVPERPDTLATFYESHKSIVDYTCHGEGEQPFVDLLRYLTTSTDAIPRGITTSNNFNNIAPNKITDFSATPSPKEILNQIVDKSPPDMKFSATLETNRGCPYSCTFCDWGSQTHAKVRKLPEDYVNELIDWYSEKKMRYVIIADANYGIFKERDFNFLRRIVTNKQINNYPDAYGMSWQKNSTDHTVQMVKYLQQNDMARGLTLSMQSMSPSVLTNIKRRNMEISKLSTVLDLCNVNNIRTYTELIIGLPGETYESWVSGLTELLLSGQHNQIEVWLCQILQNSELNNPSTIETYGIETTYINDYLSGGHDTADTIQEGAEVVCATNSMPTEDLVDAWMYSWVIISFHLNGWTQILSRWLNVTKGIAYDKFYSDFIEFFSDNTILGEFMVEQRDKFKHEMLTHDSTNDEPMLHWIPDYQRRLHEYRDDVLGIISDFVEFKFEEYGNQDEVVEFTKKYVLQWDQLPETIEFKTPIWEIINKRPYPTRTCYTYKFDVPGVSKSKEYFYDAFYFNRRHGWGKARVSLENNYTMIQMSDMDDTT